MNAYRRKSKKRTILDICDRKIYEKTLEMDLDKKLRISSFIVMPNMNFYIKKLSR